MSKKIIIFDPETQSHSGLIAALKLVLHTSVISTTDTSDKVSFMHAISNSLWDAVIVNFQTYEFWDMDAKDLEAFIREVKKCQNFSFIFVGVTGDSYQKSRLEKQSVRVIYKEYVEMQVAKAFGMSFEKASGIAILERIQTIVADYFSVPYERILFPTRKREIVRARQITMYLAKLFTTLSLKSIGQHFGGKDHTTVSYSCQTVKDLIDTEENFGNDIEELIDKISIP